ncbi:hypothetical protein [Parafannyhessea umbonata]|uniref:hypothetical protein n=1 Tax=Parafannyhessea umbonata TaxID=604330 RepID=UPI00359CAEEE
MSICISHTTALWLMCSPSIWPLVAGGRDEADLQPDFEANRTNVIRETEAILPTVCALAEWDQESVKPIDILVPRGASRRRNGICVRHSWGRALPVNAIVRLDEGIYLSTPEFAFLQMANSLDEIELALLGCSLCGRYYPCECEAGFVKRPRLTTIRRLDSFLSQFKNVKNAAKARRALRWVFEESRSPMETSTAILLSASRRMGGYGLPKPMLNQTVELSAQSSAVAGTPYYVVDLYYPKPNVAIEYLGKPYHEDVNRDVTREYVLKCEGCTLFNVTITQVITSSLRNRLVMDIAQAIGYRLRKSTPAISGKRNALLNRILPHPSQVLKSGEVVWKSASWALPLRLPR